MDCPDSTMNIPMTTNCENSPIQSNKYELKNDLVFKNGLFYGRVIGATENSFTVKVDNGNKYMAGHTREFIIDI